MSSGYTCIPNDVLDEHGADLGPVGIAVYMALARHANTEGEDSWPSVATICAKVGASRPTVHKALAKLEAIGLVEISARWRADGGRSSNMYALPMHPTRTAQTPVKEIDTPCKESLQAPVKILYSNNTPTNKQPEGAKAQEAQQVAPAPVAAPSFAETVRTLIVEAQTSKNKAAALRTAFVALYGDQRDVPAFGYLMKTAKQVGGPARLVELMAQHVIRPPVGDLMAYIVAAHKGGRNQAGTAEGPSSVGRMKVLA